MDRIRNKSDSGLFKTGKKYTILRITNCLCSRCDERRTAPANSIWRQQQQITRNAYFWSLFFVFVFSLCFCDFLTCRPKNQGKCKKSANPPVSHNTPGATHDSERQSRKNEKQKSFMYSLKVNERSKKSLDWQSHISRTDISTSPIWRSHNVQERLDGFRRSKNKRHTYHMHTHNTHIVQEIKKISCSVSRDEKW